VRRRASVVRGPTTLATADVPLRRPGSAEEMAACCLFLASDGPPIVTGTSLVAVGYGLAVKLTGTPFANG
jgi:meso-butanediol dehydrogenase / (S,S)-butanediol dehydrogenase / diacetyl reductase